MCRYGMNKRKMFRVFFDKCVPFQLSCKPAEKSYSRLTDSNGRKIIIKVNKNEEGHAAAASSATSEEDTDTNDFGACRTRPIKMVRRRRILSTKNFFRHSLRGNKESTVRCDCARPNFWCPICYGRKNHTQAPEPLIQDRGQCLALLDHSYHQVLSTKADVKLDIHLMQKIKNRSWLRHTGLEAGKGEAGTGKDAGMASEVMLKKEKRLKRLRMKEESEKGSSEGAMSAYRKRMKRRMEQESFLVMIVDLFHSLVI